ncbi:outer membrane beta-barrel protein [Flavobacterium sp. ov086]|uniref:outer membrane beta-barrel protein n=1 Tax=Flavobacterium sp. ov086 TaxID=1761785 RepID=UPI000B6C7EC8|nr:outer membrane beta-barrel protein [Flavobacterium sp. ov086]SNR63768.1 Outer membrane protein beta-barrel domain-containing protein [Flavobacterium sp. ov086]
MKNTYTIFFMLFFILKISAQQEGLTFGISGGLNSAYLTGKNIDNLSNDGYQKSTIGQTIGITLDNKTSKYFGLKHELFYSRRFMTIKINDGINPEFTSKFKRQYIDIFPASPCFYYKGFQVYAGPYLGVLLNASVQHKDTNGNTYTDKSIYGTGEAPSNYSQKMDAGFVAGLNYELPNGINIGGRFIRGFVPLIENANTKQQWKIYNESFFVTIGYTFSNP